MEQRVERVDTIPLIIYWLMKMRVHEIIDAIYKPHTNWEGLSYGQLALLFITYVLYCLTHRLCGMEAWLVKHKTVIEQVTGWEIDPKNATDDRLGKLIEVLGKDEDKSTEFQLQMGRHLIHAYDLPTKIARYDLTSFNVYHKQENSEDGLLHHGHSKDHRPDLLQFKQSLGAIDPAGIPLITETIRGNEADDRYYVPAWRRMAQIIGHKDFLMVADCKAAALESRATISKEQGHYLFPLPMTGETPNELKNLVLSSSTPAMPIVLEPRTYDKQGKQRVVGVGFVVEKEIAGLLEDKTTHKWTERWMVARSDAHAARQKKGIVDRLAKVNKQLTKLKPQKEESANAFQARADKIIKAQKLKGLVVAKVEESVSQEKKYIGRGRSGINRPFNMVEIRKLSLVVENNQAAIEESLSLAGWRIYVTNTPETRMSLEQSTEYYRNEWLVERGFHRFKGGCLPVLPLFLRLDDRIRGLMLLLTVGLQALTLIEFAVRRELESCEETLSGLVPGNPKMKTKTPTAERLLDAFDNIHMLVEKTEAGTTCRVIEELNPVQRKILSLLKIPLDLYELSLIKPKIKKPS